jgi:putative transposase
VRLVDPADVIAKLVYVATNPVAAHLVERAHQWPGVNGLADLLSGCVRTILRPRHFFRADGVMPEVVTLELVIPPQLGDPDEIRRILRERVAAAAAAERGAKGITLLGRRAVLEQGWRQSPSTSEPRRGLRPRITARSVWSRVETP